MPLRVGDLHRELVGDLALAILGEALAADAPGLVRILARDDADADARVDHVSALVDLLAGWLRVLDRGRTDLPRGCQACVGRAGDEDAGIELGG